MPITGYFRHYIAQKVQAMPDGTKGGDGASYNSTAVSVYGENATGNGNGGGGVVLANANNVTKTAVSGAGSDGAIFLYARRIPKKGAAG